MTQTPQISELLASLKQSAFVIQKQKTELAAYREAIALVGMACRFPGAASPEAFWEILRDGRDLMTDIPPDRWNIADYYDPTPGTPGKMMVRHGAFIDQVDQFDAHFFGISPREAVNLDPQQRLLLEVSWEALERAGLATQPPNQQTGVFLGMSSNDYSHLQPSIEQIEAYTATGNAFCFASGRIAYVLGVQGPNMVVDTACSASLVAVHLACQSLRMGECRIALAGGVNLMLSPNPTIAMSQMHALAPDGRCKTFDAAADGINRGEGCGIIVLKRLTDAVASHDNILAVIRGSAVNHDGPSSGLTVPNKQAQETVIRNALKQGKVAPHEVAYVEAHGTGTALGDPIEVRALAAVFATPQRQQPLLIGSVKTNIGHLEAAAGIASLIKVVLALQHNEIPPHLHFQTPTPHIDWTASAVQVPTVRTPWPTGQRLAGVSSFGMGGTNAHVILAEAPLPQSNPPQVGEGTVPTLTRGQAPSGHGGGERPIHLLTLSAKRETALHALAQRYADHLANHADLALGDICYTANTGRNHFAHRLSITAASLEEMQTQIAAFVRGEATTGIHHSQVLAQATKPKLAFLFTGQGAQYVDMGRSLYETQPTFRQALDHCDELLRPYLGESLLAVLYPEDLRFQIDDLRSHETNNDAPAVGASTAESTFSNDQSRVNHKSESVNQTRYTQPALFAIEYALAELWQAWGIRPDFVLGHSVGELVGACVAGVFSLADALKLVAARGRLMQALPQAGMMVAVWAAEAQIQTRLTPYVDSVAIAAVNGPQQVVISGLRAAVQTVVAQLHADGIQTQELTVSHAFHSPLMEPMLAEFEQIAQQITYAPPKVALVSNVTGKLVTAEVTKPAYWVRHVREPVRFADSIATLHEQGVSVLLEIGPKPTLLGMAQAIYDLRFTIDEKTPVDETRVNQKSKSVNPALLPSLHPRRDDWQQLLESLSALYGHGVMVDWAGFDQPFARRKVVLPTYPFQRQRYWVEAPPHQQRKATLRPLIDKLMQSPLLKETICETEFSVAAMPFLGDHRINGQVVSPAACHLALVLNGAELAWRGTRWQLADIVFPAPLLMPADEKRTVQSVFSPLNDKRAEPAWAFQLISFADEQDLSRLQKLDSAIQPPTHATGQVAALLEAAPTAAALTTLSTRCSTPIALEPLYQALAGQQIELGPHFRWLKTAWRGVNEALAIFRAPVDLGSMAGYVIHPGLLDACFQLAGLTHPVTAAATMQLPFAVEKLAVYQTPKGDEWWGHAQQVAEARWNIHLYDAQGQVLVEISGFVMRAAPTLTPPKASWQEWLYTVRWAAHPLPDLPTRPEAQAQGNGTISETPSHWLICADTLGIGDALAVALRQRGEQPVIVKAGAAYAQQDAHTFTIAPDAPADYVRLLKALPAVQGVIHLWSLDTPTGNPTDLDTNQHEIARFYLPGRGQGVVDVSAHVAPPSRKELAPNSRFRVELSLDVAGQHSCGTLLHLVQTLLQTGSSLAGLWLVTQDAQAISLDDKVVGVGQAPVWGLGKVIALEHPELHPVCIDLDAAETVERQAAALCAELLAAPSRDSRETQVALRQGKRYVARLARFTLPVPPSTFTCHAGATYLITGGLGGLGLLVARWLIEHGAKHLVLVGRSQPTPEAQRHLDQLAALGATGDETPATVTFIQADVADYAQLARALSQIDPRYPLRGIIHAAGVVDDAALWQQDWARFARVQSPKIAGAWHLHRLTEKQPLDFFVLFSSAAGLLGSPGQANYAAANAFLDAFAQYRRGQQLPALSISWGAWAEVGMAAALVRDRETQMIALGQGVITPQQGLAALAGLLPLDMAHVGVLPLDWAKLGAGSGVTPPFLEQVVEQSIPADLFPAADLLDQIRKADPAARRERLNAYVRQQLAQLLRYRASDELQMQTPLLELGMNSLLSVELRNRINRALNINVPLTALLNTTSEQLALTLADHLLRAEITAPDSTPALAEETAGQNIKEIVL